MLAMQPHQGRQERLVQRAVRSTLLRSDPTREGLLRENLTHARSCDSYHPSRRKAASSYMATTTHPPNQLYTVEEWRYAALIEAGYTKPQAQDIAACTDIDLHQAVALLEHGCPPATAARILL